MADKTSLTGCIGPWKWNRCVLVPSLRACCACACAHSVKCLNWDFFVFSPHRAVTGVVGLTAWRCGANHVTLTDMGGDMLSVLNMNVGVNVPKRRSGNVTVQSFTW